MYASLGTLQIGITLMFFKGEDGESLKDSLDKMDKDIQLFLAVVFSLGVGISTGLLFAIQTYFLLTNKTTIESSALSPENPFDKGMKENWVQVFGRRWFVRGVWLLPINAKHNEFD